MIGPGSDKTLPKRHNGPEGWVLLYNKFLHKSWSNSKIQNLNQTSAFRPNFNIKILGGERARLVKWQGQVMIGPGSDENGRTRHLYHSKVVSLLMIINDSLMIKAKKRLPQWPAEKKIWRLGGIMCEVDNNGWQQHNLFYCERMKRTFEIYQGRSVSNKVIFKIVKNALYPYLIEIEIHKSKASAEWTAFKPWILKAKQGIFTVLDLVLCFYHHRFSSSLQGMTHPTHTDSIQLPNSIIR